MACITEMHQRNEAYCKVENNVKKRKIRSRDMWILFIHNMCVIKAGTHWCVRNDIETHSTGVTGLHSQWSRLCNPVTQSLVFHCHFAHTMRSCYIDSRYLVVKYNRNQDIGLNRFGPLTPTSIVIQLRTSTDWKERIKMKVARRYFIKWKIFFFC